MRVGSLFAGIGGFDLGLERAGMEIAWQVEIDPFCRAILKKHWPRVPRYGDIRRLSGNELAPVDLICGGWPCQPFSLAGKRRASADERDLWPEFIRIIRHVRPRWVLGENVYGILSAEKGRYFGRVLGDLAASGYDAAWRVLRAADVGAPHLRKRVFLVAYTNGTRLEIGKGVAKNDETQQPTPLRSSGRVVESVLGGVLDGLSGWMDGHRWPAGRGEGQHDWEPPRSVGGREVPQRIQRVRSLGNAVVPQIVEMIGRRIMAASNCHKGELD